jgi:hypothetical protein
MHARRFAGAFIRLVEIRAKTHESGATGRRMHAKWSLSRGLGAPTARLIRAQNAAVTRKQLLALGWSSAEIKTRVRRGDWHRRYQGVYIAGDPALLPLAAESAALLSLGPNAVLSHRSAAALWSLAERDGGGVDVTLVARSARPRSAVRIHLVGALDPRDVRHRENLAVTSPARTLIDFAATAAQTELMQALGEAVARNLADERELWQALERVAANHPGAAVVRAILRDEPQLIHAHSVAERDLLPAIRHAGLPPPLVNPRVCGEVVDLYWPEHKLVVEFDGFQFHRSRAAFESDRRRDAKLVAAGLRVIRVTWLQLQHEPYVVIARIAQALVARTA